MTALEKKTPGERMYLKMLARAIGWDLRLQLRYRIAAIATLVTFLYAFMFRMAPESNDHRVVVLLIFSDPSMFGFLFIGAMMLFEKRTDTLQAVVVTPLSVGQYLWSKAISLTILATLSGCIMALSAEGMHCNYLALLIGIVLTSLLFVFLGIIGVAHVRSLNEYLIIIPIFLAPATLPLLNFFKVTHTPLLFAIPTQASLILLEAAFRPVPTWQLAYAVIYLIISIGASFAFARLVFNKYIRSGGR